MAVGTFNVQGTVVDVVVSSILFADGKHRFESCLKRSSRKTSVNIAWSVSFIKILTKKKLFIN